MFPRGHSFLGVYFLKGNQKESHYVGFRVSNLKAGDAAIWLWVNTAPPIFVYFSENWDVHWGCDFDFDPWPFRSFPTRPALARCEGATCLQVQPRASAAAAPAHTEAGARCERRVTSQSGDRFGGSHQRIGQLFDVGIFSDLFFSLSVVVLGWGWGGGVGWATSQRVKWRSRAAR